MASSRTTCDPQRIKRLLNDELAASDESLVTEHIGECVTCRMELENLAADRAMWQEVSRSLCGCEWKEDGTLWLTTTDLKNASDSSDEETADTAWILSLDFLESSDNPAMLGRLGSYDILEVIGSGGFGIVLKGYDRELNRHVAVKVLAPHLANSGAARKRFAREAQAAAAVVHPHVVAIHTVDASGKLPYIVMPFIAGNSLQERLDREGPLGVKEILRIGMQTSQGLAAAHAQGLVHRDIKPANILLEHDVDRVMLTDFGLARAMDDASITRSAVIAGTPQYMSPEQARGEDVDHRTDLFSLGCVMYAMCVGHPPFRSETMLGVLRRVSEETPRSVRELNADIPGWLAAIVHQLLAKSAGRRFQSAAELAELLEQCLAHVQQPTVVPLPKTAGFKETWPESLRQKMRRHGMLAGGVAIACLIAVAGSAYILSGIIKAGQSDKQTDSQVTHTEKENGSSPLQAVPEKALEELEWHDDVSFELDWLQQRTTQLEAEVEKIE